MNEPTVNVTFQIALPDNCIVYMARADAEKLYVSLQTALYGTGTPRGPVYPSPSLFQLPSIGPDFQVTCGTAQGNG